MVIYSDVGTLSRSDAVSVVLTALIAIMVSSITKQRP